MRAPAGTAIAKRVAGAALTVLASTVIIFSAIHLTSGSPINALTGGRTISPEARAELEARYHLDEPLPEQYVRWLGDVGTGELGTSIVLRQPVTDVIKARIGTTALLVLYAGSLITLLGLILGVVAALRPGRVDNAIVLGSTFGVAVPSFVASAVLMSVFAVGLGWFPVFGTGEGLVDQLWHLTLPAIALALSATAFVASVVRAAVRQELARDYVDTARVRGLTPRRVVVRHVLRNAMIPIVTVSGLTIGSLIAGSTIVETAFQLDGLGSYLVKSVQQLDFPVIQGISLLFVLAFVVINGATDIAYRVLDPRIRASGGNP